MTASNLSICVGPSLIWTHDQSYMMDTAYSKEVSSLVQILIEQFSVIFGTETPELFSDKMPAAGDQRLESRLAEAAAAVAGGGGGPAERTSSLSSTKSETGQKINKKGKIFKKQFLFNCNWSQSAMWLKSLLLILFESPR